MRPGRDGVEERRLWIASGITAPLDCELVIVDAAGDVRGQHDRGVDADDRRACSARPGRLGDDERKNGLRR